MSNPAIPKKWLPLVAVADVPPGKGTLVRHGRTDYLIFHLDPERAAEAGTEWTAFDNTCPHAGAPIYAEHFDGECVTCTYHGLRFSARDGSCPDARGWGLDRYPVKVEGDQVLVGLPDL